MSQSLYLLDAMALVYRAHFALANRPIYNSKGVNTSALFGFTQFLIDILTRHKPSHIAVVFDTAAPTQRHIDFPAYKAQREEMPEDLAAALPEVKRMTRAFRVPLLELDGFEADDIIGTLAKRAEAEGFTTHMVTPDKDFGQLVGPRTLLYKPARMGDAVEILGVEEVKARWGIERPEQVIDMLGLMGDASDNIPGIRGVGEKTAAKLLALYGTVEGVLDHASELKGKQREMVEASREMALLSKRLATINTAVPLDSTLDDLKTQPMDPEAVKALLVEFEFNHVGKRLFGAEFHAGRGGGVKSADPQAELEGEAAPPSAETTIPEAPAQTAGAVQSSMLEPADGLEALLAGLLPGGRLGLAVDANAPTPKACEPGKIFKGLALSVEPGRAVYLPLRDAGQARAVSSRVLEVAAASGAVLAGHDLKFHLGVLGWAGCDWDGPVFDTMLAHSLVEPDQRHTLAYLCETLLGILPRTAAPGEQMTLDLGAGEDTWRAVAEQAGLALQLAPPLEALLGERGQERVMEEIEMPLVACLAAMEREGIRLDPAVLSDFGAQLAKELDASEKDLHRLAGREFNVNSPKQLGEILFDELKLVEKPKKTRTGQYATNEQTLQELAADHEIVRRILAHREGAKLKSTYVDALPNAIWPATGRIHTTFHQAAAATGRLASVDPNLQNIPIRSDAGQEIRRAFIPRDADHLLLSADYSQIELRIIAALGGEANMIEAFKAGLDIHTATAARVFGTPLPEVTSEMRRKAKMVNFGIAYGISAFGLAQRLGIPRKEAAQIIDQYFLQYPGIRQYMGDIVELARSRGYAETITGRRRPLRDITSSNATLRAAAERVAINMPIQGAAADMIKIAMARVHRELRQRKLRTRMLLQVHDELVFDLYKPEEAEVRELATRNMRDALKLEVPIEVEIGVGQNWLEAH